ncbi:hypothetical protein F2P81_024911 [Scophthalmus maximus]|uniref:Uncharacterized protein n=1 Tax=Scophthalmus maximus TaxID=52904 RepID=A0A6A4RU79_SCOMX|nr:hypothetical protein F2P81_024911 [Scophthalmus maximus]
MNRARHRKYKTIRQSKFSPALGPDAADPRLCCTSGPEGLRHHFCMFKLIEYKTHGFNNEEYSRLKKNRTRQEGAVFKNNSRSNHATQSTHKGFD